jgi:hypothetical protein
MGLIPAHHANKVISVITTLCWIISSHVCFLIEVGNACEVVCSFEYDYESEHVRDHDSEKAHGHQFEHALDYDPGQSHDHGKNNETHEPQLCCKDFGSIVRPSQDSKKIENPLANAVSYLLACLVPPTLNSLKPRKEFQDTGPPHLVSSVAISSQCCLLGNAPPSLA